ncbi:MAG: adenine phosphoribosyltransferase [Deltaproteobacteria bacterium]|nr:adenine phosphoribosyltransferase [Deltaproteobacteria bacterium]
MTDLKQWIRDIPDFPKPGILFRDITPLLQSPEGLKAAIDALCAPHLASPPDLVAGIESRGFLFGSAMAYKLGCGFVTIRKPKKLPWKTRRAEYALEYGTDAIEVHEDAVKPGQSVVLVDDLLATGGTMAAASSLISGLGGRVVEYAFVIELAFLQGRKKLTGAPVRCLVTY